MTQAAIIPLHDEAAALVEPSAIGLQELVPGGCETQFSYAAVWTDGAPVASPVARRTRQYPIDIGFASTYVETIEGPSSNAPESELPPKEFPRA